MLSVTARRIASAPLPVTLALIAGTLVGIGFGSTPPAQASTCSDKTGGSNDRLIKADNAETDADGWNCAYVYDFSVKIGAFMPGYQYHTTAMGYQKTYECHNQTGGVSIDTVYIDGGGVAPSSQEWWAYNTQDGSRHWRGAVLMMTRKSSKDPAPGQYTKGCVDNTIPFNAIYAVSASMTASATSVDAGSAVTLTIKMSGPDGPTPTGVKVGVARMAGTSPDPKTDPLVAGGVITDGLLVTTMQVAPGSYSYYPVFAGSDWTTMTPPSTGWTPAQGKAVVITGTTSTPVTARTVAVRPQGVEEVRARRTAPQAVLLSTRGTGDLSLTCPTGSAPQIASAGSRNRAYGAADITVTEGRFRLRAGNSPTHLQLTCRDSALPPEIIGGRGYGSVEADIMTTTVARSFFTGGLGNDRITSRHRGSAIHGGVGADALRLHAQGVADGSYGADRLRAEGDGALLVGGPGRDTFTTGTGRVYVNAQDGRGGDTVTCGSSRTVVLYDRGDRLFGPCSVIG